MADSLPQLTADLDRFTQSRGSAALLYGAAAGFVLGGICGAWLTARRRAPAAHTMGNSHAPQPAVPAGAPRAVNTGATFSAPPSDLGSLPATPRGSDEQDEKSDVKMVLVVRQDLKMGKGKLAAQCCHATLGQFKKLYRRKDPNLKRWELSGQTKVCLRVDDEGLLQLHQAARNAGIPVHVVVDAGRTQIARTAKLS